LETTIENNIPKPKRRKTGGRRKGSKNKNTAEIRELLKKLTVELFPEFHEAFLNLSDKMKVLAYLKLLKFSAPEFGVIPTSLKALSEHDLQFVLEQLKKEINGHGEVETKKSDTGSSEEAGSNPV
jgi:hypothetical protein